VAAPIRSLERRAYAAVRTVSLPALRIMMGVVFIWFGALKLFDVTPVGDLVAATVPFLDRAWFVPALGLVEVVLGAALVTGVALRVAVPVMVAHLLGTFAVLVMEPGLAFQHGNPLLLTTIGEFVVKNTVLVAAALVIATHRRGAPENRA
jgi:uncharacterized membrane protein YphA (DoxX/SURF4 family)